MRVVVVGTGTDVGKTHLGVALVTCLARAGRSVVGLKPVESGVAPGQVGPDAAALAAAAVFHVKHPRPHAPADAVHPHGANPPKAIESGVARGRIESDPAASIAMGVFHVKRPQPYALVDAVSPHLAARRAGITVDLDVVARWVDDHATDCVLVETAGALLSPLGPGLTNLDLALRLNPTSWILVAVDRLGVLHDVAACVLALRAAGVTSPPLVVLQSPAQPDTSTGTNAAELMTLGTAPTVLTIPRGAPDSPPCQAAAAAIAARLR